MIENYMIFIDIGVIDNMQAYMIYSSTKKLFHLYIDLLKLKQNKNEIISLFVIKIKKFIKNLVGIIGYIEDLLEILVELKHIGYNQEYYEIFIYYMKLLNNEALTEKINAKYNKCKLHLERVIFDIKKYILDSDLEVMNENLKNKFLEQKKLCEEEIKKNKFFYLFNRRNN